MHNIKVSNTPILVKVLKDGSKKFRSEACPRCSGTGYLSYYGHVYNGVCFKCNGSGFFAHEWIEPSEERLEKQKLKNQIKRLESADSHNREFMKSNGFGANGKTYMVINPNTYDIKDELKLLGAKFDYILGWKLPENSSKYSTIELDINEVTQPDEFGWLHYKPATEIEALVNQKKKEYREANSPANEKISEYVGNIGERITADVTIKRISSFESHYSYYGETNYIYKFEDNAGNIYTWKTSGGLDKKVNDRFVPMQEGESCTITGTVKDHKEYKGDKETVLTRVKKL